MSLSEREIELVVGVLSVELAGAAARKVISPEAPDRVVLELRARGENHLLQIVTANASSRMGRIEERPVSREQPHPFVMLLRDRLQGTVLAAVRQLGGDRVVALEFACGACGGTLICELTSRQANLFWLGPGGVIEGSFYPNRSHRRMLVPGEAYVPPLPRPAESKAPRFAKDAALERTIEDHYCRVEAEAELASLRSFALRVARRAAEHQRRLLAKLETDSARAEEGERLRLLGYVLQANLGQVQKGTSEFAALDFEGREVTVPLDPRLSPVSNMQRLFEKAKRFGKARSAIGVRLRQVQENIAWIVTAQQQLAAAEAREIANIENEICRRFEGAKGDRARPRRGARLPQRLPYRELAITAGRPARVGRSAADNDALTLRHAKPDDLWLHVRGRKGSHVVVPMGRGEEPTPEMLIDAAHLAAHFSDARDEVDVEVSYTRRRYVQKPRGLAQGAVRLLREKTIFLRVEPGRLRRLLGQLDFGQDDR